MEPNYVAKKSVWSAITFWGVVACILIIPIFILVFKIIAVKKFRIEFYDDKIITYKGLINTQKKQTVFFGVTSTSVNQNLWGHLFNYGDVTVDCVGKWDVDTTYIKNPSELESFLQTKIVKSQNTNQFVHM